MSLSRPATFPLLKLPFLCIEAVVKSWDILDIIIFAVISKKTRQIVKHLKIPLNRIRISLSELKYIELDSSRRKWHFRNESEKELFFRVLQTSRKGPLVLQKNAIPLYTSRSENVLWSSTYVNESIALKMAMEFLYEMFKCSVERVDIYWGYFPEAGDVGVKTTVNLGIYHDLGYGNSQKLNLLLENLEVTDTCTFWVKNTENGFYCDPKLFKCRKLVFLLGSNAWVTREIFLQFEVPQLNFFEFSFSVEDILSFVTHWFHSDNKKLEYLFIIVDGVQLSLEKFQTDELNPGPFSERSHVPLSEPFRDIDFTKGLEIVRHDGLAASIHVTGRAFLFYIWHDQ